MRNTGHARRKGQTKLIFHCYGDHYVLVKAELPNTDFDRAFRAGAAETVVAHIRPEILVTAGKQRRLNPPCAVCREAWSPLGFVPFSLFVIQRKNVHSRVET